MEILFALLCGFLIGALVGTVGGGGAILALPLMVYVLDQGVSPASTASLIVVTLAAAVGAGAQARHGRVCWRIAAWFAGPAAIGAYLGTIANSAISPRVLVLCFVPVMLAAAALTYVRARPGRESAEEPRTVCPVPRLARASISGLAVGAMTGFFGVGGGFLIVPVLTTLFAVPIRRAIATSLMIIGLTGLVALSAHLARGATPDWELTAVLGGAVALGSLAGTSFGNRLSPALLARVFAIAVAVIAVFLMIDVLALNGPPAG
jgi:uncharacterized membrane protein YfcA